MSETTPSEDLTAPLSPAETADNADNTNTTNESAAVIKRIHESANSKYRLAKRRKQQELSHKIVEAQRSGDRIRLRNEKKKVDNHASAVASRIKQSFLVHSFEDLVRETMRNSAQLAELVSQRDAAIAKKDATIRVLFRRVAALTEELAEGNRQFAAEENVRSPDLVLAQDPWMLSSNYTVPASESTAANGEHPYVQCEQITVPPERGSVQAHDGQHLQCSADRPTEESTLISFTETVTPHVQEHVYDLYKTDGVPWESLHNEVINERQASFRTRFKIDRNDVMFDPAA